MSSDCRRSPTHVQIFQMHTQPPFFVTVLSPRALPTAVAAMWDGTSMRCHAPWCPFLINSDPQFGGYCCCKCFFRFKTLHKGKRKHGEYCAGHVAPYTAQIAPDIAPDWYMPGYVAAPSQPGSSVATRNVGAASSSPQAVPDGAASLAEARSDPQPRANLITTRKTRSNNSARPAIQSNASTPVLCQVRDRAAPA